MTRGKEKKKNKEKKTKVFFSNSYLCPNQQGLDAKRKKLQHAPSMHPCPCLAPLACFGTKNLAPKSREAQSEICQVWGGGEDVVVGWVCLTLQPPPSYALQYILVKCILCMSEQSLSLSLSLLLPKDFLALREACLLVQLAPERFFLSSFRGRKAL